MLHFRVTLSNLLSQDPPKQSVVSQDQLQALEIKDRQHSGLPVYLIEWALLPHVPGDVLTSTHYDPDNPARLAFKFIMLAF